MAPVPEPRSWDGRNCEGAQRQPQGYAAKVVLAAPPPDGRRRTAREVDRLTAAGAAEDARRDKALMQTNAAQAREQVRQDRQKFAVQRRLNHSRHFQKVQAEVRQAMVAAGGAATGKRPNLASTPTNRCKTF